MAVEERALRLFRNMSLWPVRVSNSNWPEPSAPALWTDRFMIPRKILPPSPSLSGKNEPPKSRCLIVPLVLSAACSMKIVETYSHLNGLEFLLVHKPALWEEIRDVIAQVHAETCRTKLSQEKTKKGKILYSPIEMNKAFKNLFRSRSWQESRVSYWVTRSEKLIRKTFTLSPDQQRQAILAAGEEPIFSYNQTDFVKDRVAVEVRFGKYAFVAYDLFVKHLAFYIGDQIDGGVEILPMKSLQSQMSSGVPYYEGELYNVVRQGRGVPAVPLVLIGIEP